MKAQTYDFIVIGTVKAGTTTLHYLLADNRQLSLPAEKEAPLFLRDVTEEQVTRHVRHFTGGPEDALKGKVTPLYMCKPGVARRIHRAGPSTRLIAMLRDPVERARSHWRMRCRFGADRRAFEDVVREQLARPLQWRSTEKEEDGYVAFGEYGRILSEYRELFPQDQLLVIGADELRYDPLLVVHRVCKYLCVESHEPATLGRDFNVSERGRHRNVEQAFWKLVPYDFAARLAGPRLQRRAGQLLDRWEIGRPDAGLSGDLSPATTDLLRAHYRADALRVPSGVQLPVWPWVDVEGSQGRQGTGGQPPVELGGAVSR